MTPLAGTDITAILAAVTGPVADNLVGILSIMAGVAGLKFVMKQFRRATK